MKGSFCSIIFLLLAGCASAELVKETHEPQKGGVVRYIINSPFMDEQENVRKAGEKMSEYCGQANPKILSEEKKTEPSGAEAKLSDYRHVTFICE